MCPVTVECKRIRRRIWKKGYDLPCAHLYVSMLQALGLEVESFAGTEGGLDGFFV